MKLTGNTVFITGGGSGIGRGLAEALHKQGNQVIISGRRAAKLKEVIDANPGMQSVELDIQDPGSIETVAQKLIAEFPKLNVLINNAGIAKMDSADGAVDDSMLTATVETNVYGPIRLTAALIEQLKSQPEAYVAYVTSGLAFTPLARGAVYSATKAMMHSYVLSQRYTLKDTSVKVLEIAPPYVQTELGGERQMTDPRAMPLATYIEETLALLSTDANEVLVEKVMPLRNNAGPQEQPFVTKYNDMMAGL